MECNLFKVGDKVHLKKDTSFLHIKNKISKDEILEVINVSLIKGTLYELKTEDKNIFIAFESELVAMNG